MITPKTQTAIAVLKCIYARDYGKRAMEISLLDILEATGGHLNCNSPITERFYAQYGRAAQKLGIVNQITRIYLKEITLTDL